MTNRYYNKEGKVGVVLTTMDDCGWSSVANPDIASQLLFDPEIVQMVLDGIDYKDLNDYCVKRFGNKYNHPHGVFSLKVEFIDQCNSFIILSGMGGEYLVYMLNTVIFTP